MIKSLLAATGLALLLTSRALAADTGVAPRVVDTIAAPDGGWDYVTVDPAHGRVFVARSAGVTVIDLGSRKASAILPDLSRTHIALPINDGKDLLVTVGATGETVVADLATGAVKSRARTGTKPDAAVYDAVSDRVWVMDNKGGGVSLVNPHTGAAEGVIATPGALEFAVSDGQGKVFANVEDLGEIVAFDVKDRKVVGHYKMAGCEEPTGLAYDPGAKTLFAACANKVAAVVSAETGALVTTIPIGSGPDAAAFDATTGRVFIPTRDGKLWVIDAKSHTVVASADTKVSARTEALDVATGRLYLPAADMTPPKTANGRPSATPGTFGLLVVSTR